MKNITAKLPDNSIRIVFAVGFVLLIPLVVMQFTDEVNWNAVDFIVAGVLLFSASFAYKLIAQKMSAVVYKVAVGAAVAVVFLLVWAELAVGIFGTPWAGS